MEMKNANNLKSLSQLCDLKNLNNAEFELQFQTYVGSERKLLHVIVLHIQETFRRRIFLERGYPSLFEYLVEAMGYSRPPRNGESMQLGYDRSSTSCR